MSKNPSFFARICWNSKEWTQPTGESPLLESSTSYTARQGFGHEEWLFRYHLIGGFQYAFLQPIHRSWAKYQGQKLDLVLWALSPEGKRVIVGTISNCEVIKEDAALQILDLYRKRNWLATMEDEVSQLPDADKSKVGIDSFFNVRFRRSDVFLEQQPYPEAPKDCAIAKVKRYQLNSAKDYVPTPYSSSKRAGTSTLPELRSSSKRSPVTGVLVNYRHLELQRELQKLLIKHLSPRFRILREDNCVDLTARSEDKTLLFEIKSSPDARTAIREALGQLLEYAFFANSEPSPGMKLFIIAPGERDGAVDQYLTLLRRKFGLVVEYCAFAPGDDLPKEVLALNKPSRVPRS
jgi:hypothetical protein